MKITKILLPSAVVASTALLVLPTQPTFGFSTIGGSLGTSQRDYRVFNNFTDAATNNNTLDEFNYPGTDGAITAIRKGAAEWGSAAHGDGGDDPLQGQIGNGFANFDFWYAGETNAAGGSNANVHSAIPGNSGSTLAFMSGGFGGISDGWTIKYYEGWTWSDGPFNAPANQIDLQGVACHEMGHALGLGHSTVNGATMLPNLISSARSINSDDQAGVQFIYGQASASKPRIDDVTVVGGVATITGVNFTATGNEVWFTEQTPAGSNGIQVTNINSTNGGTQISVNIPAGAVSGDVIVKNANAGGSSLSNTWPLNVDGQGVDPPEFYCVGKLSSALCLAILTSSDPSNQPISGAGDYSLIANGVQELKNGLFFGSVSGQASIPFNGGTLCMNPPTFRTGIQNSGGASPNGCNGQIALIVNDGVLIPFGPDAGPGGVSQMQLWYRDPNNGAGNLGTALSDAVEFSFQ